MKKTISIILATSLFSVVAFAKADLSCETLKKAAKNGDKQWVQDVGGNTKRRTEYKDAIKNKPASFERRMNQLKFARIKDMTTGGYGKADEILKLSDQQLIDDSEDPFYGSTAVAGMKIDYVNFAAGDTPIVYLFKAGTTHYLGVTLDDGDNLYVDGVLCNADILSDQ